MFCTVAAARTASIAAMALITAPMPAASVPSADTATHGSACGTGQPSGGHRIGIEPLLSARRRKETRRITAKMPNSAAILQRIRARRFQVLAASTGLAGDSLGGEVMGKS